MNDGMKIFTSEPSASVPATARKPQPNYIALVFATIVFGFTGCALIASGFLTANILSFGFGGVAFAASIGFYAAREALFVLERINRTLTEARGE